MLCQRLCNRCGKSLREQENERDNNGEESHFSFFLFYFNLSRGFNVGVDARQELFFCLRTEGGEGDLFVPDPPILTGA